MPGISPDWLPSNSRDYWLAQAAAWGTLALAALLTSGHGSWSSIVTTALVKLLSVFTGFALSHLWHALLRRRGWLTRIDRHFMPNIAAGLAAMGAAQVAVVVVGDFLLQGGSMLKGDDHPLVTLFALNVMWSFIFLVWTLCYGLALSRRRAVQLEFDRKDAQLQALQAQLNPHFFFNSLNSIRSLMYDDVDAAAQAISKLAAMMRHNLVTSELDKVRLSDELQMVEAYLGIEKLRFEERLQVSVVIEPGLENVLLPGMILQTLVENAVKYGVEPVSKPCRIRITARSAGAMFEVCVANQGRIAQHSGSTRIGLVNAKRRLALRYGEQASCQLAEADGWVQAHMILPLERT